MFNFFFVNYLHAKCLICNKKFCASVNKEVGLLIFLVLLAWSYRVPCEFKQLLRAGLVLFDIYYYFEFLYDHKLFGCNFLLIVPSILYLLKKS